jgi:hypothetical protein
MPIWRARAKRCAAEPPARNASDGTILRNREAWKSVPHGTSPWAEGSRGYPRCKTGWCRRRCARCWSRSTLHPAVCPVRGSTPRSRQYALFKEPCDQREDAAVRYLVPDTGKKTIFGDRVEIALQIGVDDVDVAGREPPFDPPQRIPRLREGRLWQPRPGQKHPSLRWGRIRCAARNRAQSRRRVGAHQRAAHHSCCRFNHSHRYEKSGLGGLTSTPGDGRPWPGPAPSAARSRTPLPAKAPGPKRTQ